MTDAMNRGARVLTALLEQPPLTDWQAKAIEHGLEIVKLRAIIKDLLDNARFDAGPDGSYPLDADTARCVKAAREAIE